jgi:ribosome-associated protein
MTTAKKGPAKKAPGKKTPTKPAAITKKKPAPSATVKTKTKTKPFASSSVKKKATATKSATKPKVKEAPLSGPMAAVKRMATAVTKALDDNKAEEIVVVDLTRKSALADYMVIASGRSARQVAALARFAEKALHESGAKRCRIEGLPQGDWAVVDSGDVVVHIFRPEVREFYQLEKLWTDDAGETPRTTTRRSLA